MYYITTLSRLYILGETYYSKIYDCEPQTTICYLITPNIVYNYTERYFIDSCFNAKSPKAPIYIQVRFCYALQTLRLKLYIYFTLVLLSLLIGLLRKLQLYLKESRDLDPYRIYYFKYRLELRSKLYIVIKGTFISISL